jgi:hypothetical protein
MLKTTFTARLGLLLCLPGLLSFSNATAVRAQDYGHGNREDSRYGRDGSNDQDPPSRVARLSYFDGSVSFQAGGSGDWGNAAKNRPVTIGDKLWVDKDARAELQAGQSSIHLGGMTALSFLNLDQNITQMRLVEGTVNFRVRELRQGDLYEVDTPNAAFTARQAGAFRIDVNEQGDGSIVTVIRGEGEVTAGGRSYDVHAGELAEFNGTDSDVKYRADRAPDPDDFDRWSADRDRREEDSVSARYVSRDMVGYSDLDDNGTWSDEPEYGHVWYPNNVAADWAPYSNGSWSYVGPWGWTWVDNEPWGFAPFHYGRWNDFGGRWGWSPGPIGGYPIYGPAFVGFLGGDLGFGGGFGLGIGWFPLGFGEVYQPWYGCGAGYLQNINVNNTYITNINNINNINNNNYVYAHNPAAVTATSRNNFVNGQRVNRGGTRVSAASLRTAQVNNHLSALTPTRASYTGATNGRSRVATPPASIQNRSVIARTAPANGASHLPVRTIGTTAARTNTSANNRALGDNSATRQLSTNRPGTNNPALSRQNSSANRLTATNNSEQSTYSNRPSANSANRAATNYSNRPNPNTDSNRPRTNTYGNRPSGNYTNRSANSSVNSTPSRSDRPRLADSGSRPQQNSQSPTHSSNDRTPSAYSGRNSSSTYSNRTAVSPRSFSAPSRDYSAPSSRGYSGPQRSYSPAERNYSAPRNYERPQHSYPAPQRPYSAPRSYEPPQRSSVPQRSYSAPEHGYAAPRSYAVPQQRSYSAPQRSYSAPQQQRSYSAPQRSYSAPQQRSYSAPAPSNGSSGGAHYSGSNPHGRP